MVPTLPRSRPGCEQKLPTAQPAPHTAALHKAIQFEVAGRSPWAALHTIKRHGGRVEGVVILEIDVPRRWLRRSKRGLYYCPRDIPPERIRGVVTFAALARSPVSGDAA